MSPSTAQRMFVAVWPTPPIVARLAELERPADPNVRWTTEDQWHVTLRFLGRVDQGERDHASTALRALDLGALLPAEAVLGPRTATLGREILQVPVAGLDALASAVVGATRSIGQPPDDRPFRGHLTLARTRGAAGLHGGYLRRFRGAELAGAWSVGEVTLVVSQTRPDGARYEVVERFGLRES